MKTLFLSAAVLFVSASIAQAQGYDDYYTHQRYTQGGIPMSRDMADVIYGAPEPMNPMLLPAIHPQDNRSHVSAVQAELQARGYNIRVDGQYGPKTKAAVKKFQRKNSLIADGVIGPQTLRALGVSRI